MPKPAKVFEIDVPNPTRGVFKSSAWHEVPAGFTVDCNNVLPYDSLGRNRPGKRPGTQKYWNLQFGGVAKFIQHLSVERTQNTGAGTSGTYLIIVCNGIAYRMLPSDVTLQRIDGGTAAFQTGRKVAAATIFNKTFITDGLVKKVYDHGAGTWGDWTASAGTFPIAGGEHPRQVVAWHGRLVLSQFDKGLGSTVFFTKQFVPTDFDYGAVPTPDMAVATDSNFRAGQLGDIVTALIPASNDRLIVGMDHSIYEFVGDPADGGSLVSRAESVGVHSDTAWCMVGSTLYFVGGGGFYRLDASGPPVNLSQYACDANFAALPNVHYYYSMAHDRERKGIWIFITKEGTPWSTRHFFYDLRAEALHGVGGFWPVTFPTDTDGDGGTTPGHGPSKAVVYDGPNGTAEDRVILLGGRDGYVRSITDGVLNDDGAAISSYCWHGPVQPGGAGAEVLMEKWRPTLGEAANFNLNYTVAVGPDPYAAYTSPAQTRTGTFTTGGRQSPIGHRLAGNTFFFKQANATLSKTHSVERVTLRVSAAGPVR